MTEGVPARSEAAAMRAGVRSLPVALLLGTIVTVATVIHAAAALQSPSIWIIPDELIYSELAKSLGEGSLPRIRGEISFDYGIGYPLLLAPIWAVFSDVETAYAAAKIVNALVLSLTSVPAYFLARRFVDERGGILVAALTVTLPAMLYAGTLVTEVALYPMVVSALLVITTAIESPRRATQLVAPAVIGLAVLVKAVALVLVPAYLAGIVLFHWLEARQGGAARERLRLYRPTWLALCVAAAGVLAVTIVGERRPQDVLGTYSSVIDHMHPWAVPGWILLHLAELDLYVAVIPLAASVAVLARGLGGGASREEHLYVAVAAPAIAAWLVAVGAFASVPFLAIFEYPDNVERLQGRSTFVLAPILLVGLAMWLGERQGTAVKLIPVAVGCAFLPAVIPLDVLDGSGFQALSLIPWVEHADRWPFAVLVFTVVLSGTFVLGAGRVHLSSAVLIVPIVLAYAVVGVIAQSSMQRASEWTRSAAWGTVGPDWIDAEPGRGRQVAVLWSEPPGRAFVDLAPRHRLLFVGEFFNRSVGTVYEIGSPLPYGLPTTAVRLANGDVVLPDGRRADVGSHVLAPCQVRVVGEITARDPSTGARLIRIREPLRAWVSDFGECAKTAG